MSEFTHHTELTDDSGFVLPVEFRIEFDYSPFERSSRDCPGSPEEVRVTSATVFVGNFELGPHPAPLAAWEAQVWAHIQSTRQADELDRGLARAA